MLFLLPAQMARAADMSLGAHIGYISSSASITPESAFSSTEGTSGIAFGVKTRLENDLISLQPELNWVPKGYTITTDAGDFELSAKYFEVPVFFKIKAIDSAVPAFVLIGPNLAFKVAESCYFGEEADEETGERTECTSSTIGFSTFNVSIDIGAATEFNLFGNFAVTVDLRYSIGVSDVFSATDGSDTNLDITLKAVEIFVGGQWPF